MIKIGTILSVHRNKLKIALIVIAGLAIVSVIVQLAYPSNLTLPGQKIAALNNGFKTESTLKADLEQLQKESKLTLQFNDKQQTVAWHELGITIDQEAVLDDALDYPLPIKLIPFSSLYRIARSDTAITTVVDEEKLKSNTERLSTENYQSPANATLSISGTTIVRNAQKNGHNYVADQIAQQIKQTPYKKDSNVKMVSTEVPPKFSSADVENIAQKAEAIIASGTKVDAGGTTQTASSTEIATWLQFKETNDAQHLAVDVDREKVRAYLNGLNKNVYKAPGTMTITLRDGQELSRTADTSGQSLDLAKGPEAVAANILGGNQAAAAVPIIKLPPKISYQRSYTKSQLGFSTLLNDISAEDGDMAISLRTLNGSGINASARGGVQYHPASTYKLLIAYSLIKRIEAGSMQWSDQINGGRSADKCLTDMIVVSDNPCASALGDKMGWKAVTDEGRAIGMSRTNLSGGFVSTTDDQAIFLAKLQGGQLMNGGNRDKLLSLMRQQKYRSGIPAGVGGATVADKVGFINGLLHDSAIVYSPQGTYVLVIYSNKSSWAKMAAATAKINSLMNQ